MLRRIKAFASRAERGKPKAINDDPIYGIGVTSADISLPCFDGTSTDPKDFLIDLDTDSMEKAADVRSYFYLVAEYTKEGANAPPEDMEERKLYDDRMVKAGRGYLKSARDRGHGYYLSPARDLLALNVEGGPWYRMPTAGVVDGFVKKEEQRMEGEEGFEGTKGLTDAYPDEFMTSRGYIWLTNIRCPVWWNECLLDGVGPGTRGWDEIIYIRYTSADHPASIVWYGGGRRNIIDSFWRLREDFVDPDRLDQVMMRDWRHAEDYSDDEDGEGDDSGPNEVNWNIALLAEILHPKKSKGKSKRSK